jgi:hypothetical protein
MLIYSGTENFVFCLCASIPVLRPLWSQVRGYGSSGESYQLSDHHGSRDPERAKNSNGLSGSNGPGPETRIYASAFRDDTHNGSDESILRQGNDDSIKNQPQVHGREVLCSTEVSVKYSQRGGNRM